MNAISGILFFIAFLPYVLAITSGEANPSLVTWFIWAAVDSLALVAMLKRGARAGQLIGATSGAWVIFALALMYGTTVFGAIEIFSLVLAVVGVALWQKTKNATNAIIFSQIATFVGAFPTFANAYSNPSQEDALAWSIWFLSCVFALLAVRKWDIANALQPITFTTIEGTMVFLVVIKPLFF